MTKQQKSKTYMTLNVLTAKQSVLKATFRIFNKLQRWSEKTCHAGMHKEYNPLTD